jgi:hypothetical protein
MTSENPVDMNLTFCMCTVLLCIAFAFGFLAPYSTIPAFASNNVTNQTANFSGLQNRSETCSTWIGIALEEGSENNPDIRCLERVLERCRPFEATLGYVLGSMRISINGLSNGRDNCILSLGYEIERGQTNMTCTIPITKISTWTNWKGGDGLDAVDQIRNYCVTQ